MSRLLKPAAAAAVALVALSLALTSGPATGADLGQLNSALGQQQSQQHSLSASLTRLSQLIGSLDAQISLVRAREAAVQAQLDTDKQRLVTTRAELTREQARLALLKAQLAHSRMLLQNQLVSAYENPAPNVVSVVLNAHGFSQLLDQLQYLGDAEHQQQSIITFTKRAKAEAHAAAVRLAQLQRIEQQTTEAAAQRVAALAGMNSLLQSRQSALARAQSAQQDALAASRARGRQLQADIAHVEAQQAAAERAAAAASNSSPTALGPALGPSGGWAIPYAIVLCESGGQNLTPNSAGASGYYQIIPGTWRLFGGTGPAAYLASKAEQDAVASRIWNNGAGASNWVCAGIVGIH
ncbi:MAG TPA: transglycosylase family protein [Solirubrobacteraceae bacterium]|nr:transglycosylase family protein [Solirubrobacteraceae bacterium]